MGSMRFVVTPPERLTDDLVGHAYLSGIDRLAWQVRARADGDQLDQLLINLVTNAVDAALETNGDVRVGWSRTSVLTPQVELWVDDTGPGLPETSNLFVPFFTTKPQGSGIGLVLSRQIAEAHDGSLTLENRRSRQGCRARLRLPVKAS